VRTAGRRAEARSLRRERNTAAIMGIWREAEREGAPVVGETLD